MAQSVGTAYLTLVPKLQTGWQSSVNSGLKSGVDGTSAGTSAGSGFASGFGGVVKGIAGLAVVQQAASAVAGVFTSAFSGAADYEQLTGGVETLFKGSASTVEAYAQNAYQTSGLSANEYMENVTSFSASLISSLGGDTAAAAEYANTAMTDMSDNANKMGTDMESIQNAYQGFAKQNYTMLDNLKLGYGGTKEEMERLLEDASAISGIDYDISSYADVVSAIHVVQENMGIAGTTAEEAANTMSGSLSMAQSAWDNLVTAMGTGEGIDTAMQAMMDSAQAVLSNAIPLVQTILSSLASNLPTIVQGVMSLVQQVMSQVSANASSIGPTITTMISGLLQTVIADLPSMLGMAVQIVSDLAVGLIQSLPTLIAQLPAMLDQLITGLQEQMPTIIGCVANMVGTLVVALPGIMMSLESALFGILSQVPGWIMNAVGNLPSVGSQIIQQLASGVTGMASSLVSNFTEIGGNLIKGLWNGINSVKDWIWSKISGFCDGITDAVKGFFHIGSPSKLFAEIGVFLGQGLGIGIEDGTADAVKSAQAMSKAVTDATDVSAAYSVAKSATASSGSTISSADSLEGMGIYLDGKTLVGCITRDVNKSLGRIQRLSGGLA